ncbi:MAG: hypothetical protein DCF32_02975 [Leptolyngbya sp.]|nr:MAG: hypothetical protein DCF32_02975 [Leptolyngbya sp.]
MRKTIIWFWQTIGLYVNRVFDQEVLPRGEFQGSLDFPGTNVLSAGATLLVQGWLLHREHPIQQLTLAYKYLNCREEITIPYGLERPDVAAFVPDALQAGNSGFAGTINLRQNDAGAMHLAIWATLETGDRFCCFTRTVRITPASERQETQPTNSRTLNSVHPWQQLDLYQRWRENNRITPALQTLMEAASDRLCDTGTTISIIVPVYNCPEPLLREMIASVLGQIYPKWELCLADDASPAPHVKMVLSEAVASDPRIKAVFCSENRHVVASTNSALELATGDYVAFLDHDDLLSPDALLQVAECIAQHPDVDWIYTDEDKIDEAGRHYDPKFKSSWDAEMAITYNFTHHLRVIRRSVVEAVGGLRLGFEGAQDLDLILRVAEYTRPDRIRHISKVCYHWRAHAESTASGGRQKHYVFDSAYRAIKEAVQRRGLAAEVYLPDIGEKYDLCLHQLRWNPELLAQSGVTIVIPTKDKVSLLRKCIESLERTVNPHFVKLIIVDDNSQELETQDYLQQLKQQKVFQCTVVRPDPPLTSFNYSELVNLGTSQVKTPYVLHLNNDIEAVSPGWIEEMVGWLSVPGVGVVGAKLLYPEQQTIQHAGVVIGAHHGLADHQFHRLHKDELGYLFLPHVARNSSAVTGACLMTSTRLYQELGGFDETNFAVEYNDTDYCQRAIAANYRVVFTPSAVLTHHTSASRRLLPYNPKEHLNFVRKYRQSPDPFFNENLNIDSMTMAIDPYHCCHIERAKDLKLKVLIITHNLNLEGAPLVVYYYARHFATAGSYAVTVLSPSDGILRQKYEELGISVQLTDSPLPQVEETDLSYRQRLQSLGQSIDIANYDVVVCNTLVTCWGIKLAKLFGLPVIWHVHESTSIEESFSKFFGRSPKEIMRALLEESFSYASRVVFQANTTRQIFHQVNSQDNARTIPGGIDLEGIENFRNTHDKAELRAKYKIDLYKTVIVIIGTTCERKGQHIFLEALHRLQKKNNNHPNNDLCYLIVGAREDQRSYIDLLEEKIKLHNLKNVRLIKETPDVNDFFALADIFVCASFVESFPRVLLLAMAFELKIISTNVFGIPEMMGHGEVGLMVEPGDPDALAAAILTYLNQPQLAARFASNGYARVHRIFDNQILLQQHLELLQEAYLMNLA